MASFQHMDQGSVNFFALMFFVVALGNVIAYAFAGWLANVLAQVCIGHQTSDEFLKPYLQM